MSVYVYKPLPPGVYPIAVDKYINNLQRKQQQFLQASFKTATKKLEKHISLLLSSEMSVLHSKYNFFLVSILIIRNRIS
jgi:hypothetical protein